MTHSPDTGGDLSEATAEPGFLTVAPLLPAVDKIHRQLKQPRGLEAAGKLEVVKQEMARVNVDILGISELKWTGMGEFNLDDHYIYYCGQESLRRNEVAMDICQTSFIRSDTHSQVVFQESDTHQM